MKYKLVHIPTLLAYYAHGSIDDKERNRITSVLNNPDVTHMVPFDAYPGHFMLVHKENTVYYPKSIKCFKEEFMWIEYD